VLTEDKFQEIQALSEISTRKLSRRLLLETGVSLRSAFTAVRLNQIPPASSNMLELEQPDHTARIHFWNLLLQNVHDRVVNPLLQFVADDALL
jgi:hypothetical protein